MIKNLIWDVDGTLFDTYPAIVSAFQSALGSFGKSAPAVDIDALARVSLTSCAASLAGRLNLDENLLADRFSELYGAVPKAAQPPFEGVEAVCRLIVNAGGANTIATHRGRSSTEELLSVHRLSGLFIDMVAGDEGYPKKPDPASFLALIQRHKLDTLRTAAVGDREIDIQAGQAAGVTVFWFRGTPSTLEPDLLFEDYQQLLDYLTGNTGI